jgi:hypothetical protein
MRRLLALWCLTATLLAPLLATAEAAEALADSLAELVNPHVIEPGGDPDDGTTPPTIKAERPIHDADTAPAPCGALALPLAPSPGRVSPLARPGDSPRPPDPPGRRQALLSVFLF